MYFCGISVCLFLTPNDCSVLFVVFMYCSLLLAFEDFSALTFKWNHRSFTLECMLISNQL